jgi:glycosyltransferase involved in cell wall biosynthesis
MSATIALIMTCFNRQRYLALAIESILAQTYPQWELEIWDDCSIDNSLEIARSYAAIDSRIKTVPLPSNIGHAPILAASTSKGTTPYLGWVDSDDLLAPTALAETIAILEAQPEIGMVYSQQMLIDEEGRELGLPKNSQVPYHHNRLLSDFLCHHFRLVRRTVLDAVGGVDPSCFSAEDYDLALKISEVTKIKQLWQPLYYYRIHPQSVSAEHRGRQSQQAAAAVRQALVRRGLDDVYWLDDRNGFNLRLIADAPPAELTKADAEIVP